MIKYNIYDFINYIKKNHKNFINYCEIIIDRYGNIIICRPSHTETVLKYVMEKENKTRDEVMNNIPITCSPLKWCVDKYGLIAIWHCGYIYGTYKRKQPNRFQRRSINILIENGLIKDNGTPTREYSLYLYRKSIGYEE